MRRCGVCLVNYGLVRDTSGVGMRRVWILWGWVRKIVVLVRWLRVFEFVVDAGERTLLGVKGIVERGMEISRG